MKTNRLEIAEIAFDCVRKFAAQGFNYEEADSYALDHDQALKIAHLLHEDCTPDQRHESLCSGDSFDCYGELLMHNPSEFVSSVQNDLIEYYRCEIDEKIAEAVNEFNRWKLEESAMMNAKDHNIFSGVQA